MTPVGETIWPSWFGEALAAAGHLSYPQYLFHRAAEVPDHTALIHRDRRWTYRELVGAVAATAGSLRAHAGQRIVLNVDNGDTYVIVYLAALAAGCVVVPVNPKLTASELAYLIGDAEAALYLHDEAAAAGVPALQHLLRDHVPEMVRAEGLVVRGDEGLSPQAVDVDAPAAIFYTSGTTGHPKGVVHTHRTLVAGALQAAHAWGYAHDGLVNLAVTPMFHIAAHSWAFPTWAHVGTLVVDSYGTERVFRLIEEHRVNGFGCVPSMLMMMLRSEHREGSDLRSVTNVRFGASPMPPDRLRDVQALFPNASLYHGMGQTESCGTISVLPPELALERAGSTGVPLPGCEVRIVDDEDRDVPTGTAGEVLARSPSVMQGYFRRDEATRETLRGGWLHTGDVGYLDEQGLVWLVDRKKDMIIRGGENIYSVEVENVLLQHADVPACAVIGLPDEVLGERVCAVIATPEPADPARMADMLKTWCRERLAAFKVPEVVTYLPQMPQTATGKVQKAALRELVRNRLGEARDRRA